MYMKWTIALLKKVIGRNELLNLDMLFYVLYIDSPSATNRLRYCCSR